MRAAPPTHASSPQAAAEVTRTNRARTDRPELRVGLVGCGHHARAHLAMIAAEPRMRLVAIAELDDERLSEAHRLYKPQYAFTDYAEMLEKAPLDVVYVLTHPAHLLPIVQSCLELDLHTSIEKSPGMTSRETEEMLAASQQTHAKTIVSFNRRYVPEVLLVRNLLQEHGGPVHVATDFHKPPADPAWRETSPAEIVSDAIHHVDLLRWLAGPAPTEAAVAEHVLADSWMGSRPGTPRYNALITFHTGCRGVMMCHYGVGYRIQRFEAHAEDFSAFVDLAEATSAPPTARASVALYEDDRPSKRELSLDEVGGADFNETRHFADCILNDAPTWSSLEDAVHTMRLAEAIDIGHRGRLD